MLFLKSSGYNTLMFDPCTARNCPSDSACGTGPRSDHLSELPGERERTANHLTSRRCSKQQAMPFSRDRFKVISNYRFGRFMMIHDNLMIHERWETMIHEPLL